MAIRCPQCGLENPDTVQVCPRCGTLSTHIRRPDADEPGGTVIRIQDATVASGPGETVIRTQDATVASGPGETVVRSQDAMAGSAAARTSGPRAGGDVFQDGDDLGPRYQIRRLLGRGGMGSVYLAHDRELGREVAIKVIASQLLENAESIDRFKREIRLSSLVTHPNVLRVYDFSEADGTKFLTMQYVEGRSLDGVLREDRPVPIDRAIALFRQICEGLAAAHGQGILHRDMKPQNVMVDAADRVYLTDFGLATSQFVTAMTQTGGVLGTPHYMSPEQVRGEQADARSDIFSLGVVLYEMLTGVLPYKGNTLFELMIKRTQSPPQPAQEINPAIPTNLLGVLDRCLAIDKEQRYASVRDIVTDLDSGTVSAPILKPPARSRAGLRWLAAAGLGVALLAAAGGTWAYLRSRPGATPTTAQAAAPVPMVGVVPFVNRTGDASLDWAGDGVARLVADSLTLSRHVRVVSPQRVAALRSDASSDAAFFKASAESGINFLLTGEILTGPKGFTVATRLTDTRSGTDVASNRVDSASKADVIGASNQVASAARRGLRIPLTEQVDTFNADFATQKIDAYEVYVQGLNAVSAYKYDDAARLFKAALEKAPDFTMARFRLANVYASMGETAEATKQIVAALAEASRLPDREARYIRALDAYIARNYDEATKQYKELADRYPYDLEPRQFLAQVYLSREQWQEAIEQANAMAQIDPQSHSTYAVLGSAHLGLKEYNQALTEFRKYADLEPGSSNAHHLLADAYRAQGVPDLAATEYRKALAADPAFHFSTVSLAEVEAVRGQPEEAERLLEPLVRDPNANPSRRADAAIDLAAIRRAQGRFRDAIKVLQEAQAPIRAEKVREAMSVAVQALSYAELGDLREAERLAREAIRQSPGVPTRYLFALAQVQLAQGKIADARATASEILKGALPPSDPDRTEDKAAAFVRGLALLKEGKAQQAQEELSRAVALSGYEYAVYRLGLARAYLKAGAHAEALASVKQAETPGNPSDPRLDLDLDRVRAGLLEAEINLALGRRAEASSGARKFLEAWAHADPGLPDVTQARRLAGLQ